MAALLSNRKYDVFLSHSSVDKPRVEELARRLKQAGIEPFLDKWNLVPGGPWQERSWRRSRRAPLRRLCWSRGLQPLAERRAAGRDRAPRQRQPGWIPGHPGLAAGGVAARRGGTTPLPAARNVGPIFWVARRRAGVPRSGLRHSRQGLGQGPGQAIFKGESPYRGLEVFEEKHARFFFGREAQINWLLSHRLAPMAESGHAKRFLSILGPSGSGKSSLALAGLIPALKRARSKAAGWPIVVFRPGSNPLESLAIVLSGVGGLRTVGRGDPGPDLRPGRTTPPST